MGIKINADTILNTSLYAHDQITVQEVEVSLQRAI